MLIGFRNSYHLSCRKHVYIPTRVKAKQNEEPFYTFKLDESIYSAIPIPQMYIIELKYILFISGQIISIYSYSSAILINSND